MVIFNNRRELRVRGMVFATDVSVNHRFAKTQH